MSEKKFETLGPIYAQIGGALANIVNSDPNGTFLYAEAGPGWMYSGVFKDEGEVVRYFDPSRELGDLLFDAWDAEDPDKRWAVMEYQIRGSRFDANFLFAGDIDQGETKTARRRQAVKRKFGDKPVIYPPRPESRHSSS